MKMTFRWFGKELDSVPLTYIKQIPKMTGVVTSLMDIPVGEVWPLERLQKMKEEINAAGLEVEVIESVNVHEDIKLGLETRDLYIKNYIETMKNLSLIGIKVLCYNFMPVLDWARHDLKYELEDGSKVLSYRHDKVIKLNPKQLAKDVEEQSDGYELPGWEPERLSKMGDLIEAYSNMSEETYWGNMKYFLDEIIPYAEKFDIKMAIHPDDPPWSIFGLPKLIINRDNIRKFLDLNTSPYNGLTICTGSLGAERNNNIPEIIREFGKEKRIHFAHVRNVLHHSARDFDEAAHPSSCGSLDMYEIVKALIEVGFEGYVRPDHGRLIWGEIARPGYGLYDRAMGAAYILGLEEAIYKNELK